MIARFLYCTYMALPDGTSRPGGSGLTRSEAAILAWKKRERAKPQTPGGLPPKIAARVKEILASKRKKGKGKAPKKIDPAKEKAKQDKIKAAAAKKEEATKQKIARDMERTAKQATRETTRKQRIAERATAAQAKQAAQQKRLKQAAQARKEKAKAASATPKKEAADTAKKQAENRTKVAKEMADQDTGLSPSGSAALGDFADGKQPLKEIADQLTKMGLLEADSAGGQRLSYAGRATVNAMNRGDTRAALDAISRAADRTQAKQDTERRRVESETKRDKAKADATARRTAADRAKNEARAKRNASAARVEAARIEAARNRKAMSDIDVLEIKAGARHSRMDMAALQSIHDNSVACGASCGSEEDDSDMDDEIGDDSAEKAIKGIMDNPLYYAQHECSDIMQASNALSTLAMLIQSELVEEDEDQKHIAMLCDAAHTLVDFIDSELDELEGASKDAANDASMGPMKAVDDAWVHTEGSAVKSLDDDTIRCHVVLFGDADHPDLQRDYFTKSTDFWLDHFGWPKPITYHHGLDAATRDEPVIGHWKSAGVDEVGLWLEGQLDRAHAYYKAMRELARRGFLKPSSDSMPQWVIREPQSNGTKHLKRWPLISSALTVTPMEPRMLPVEVKAYLAEIGYETIDEDTKVDDPDLARSDATKASDEDRARAILFELDLLQIELETA